MSKDHEPEDPGGVESYEQMFRDSQDEIGRLRAEIARLEADRAHYASEAGADSCAAVAAERDRLAGLVERCWVAMRAAYSKGDSRIVDALIAEIEGGRDE